MTNNLFQFPSDRARELTRSFIDPSFNEFERKKGYFPVKFVSMTQYDATFENLSIAFGPEDLTNTFGSISASMGKASSGLLKRKNMPM